MADRPGTENPELATTREAPPPSQPDLAATQEASPPSQPDLERTRPGSEVAVDTGSLPRGASVGRYLVLDVLGEGGMGVVYAAYDPELDRKVALKLMRAGLRDDGRARIHREAQAIARLAHPNVVAVHDVGTYADDQVFLAMELVDGTTVGTWLREDSRSNAEILDVFIQAGRGLAAAHRAGLVHRDFKPENVLVGRDGRARVVDFGLVRELPKEEPYDTVKDPNERPSDPSMSMQLTQAGAIMGTPYYMAPEQFLRGDTDARTDQYSYCVSLFEALCGRRPFEGDTLNQVSQRVLSGKVPDLQPIHTVAKHIRAAIKRGMAIDPADRFPSMEVLLAELARDPSLPRKRAMIAFGLIGAAGVTVFAVSRTLATKDRGELCAGGEELVAAVWGPAQAKALTDAFAATGSPYATESAATVVKELDAYRTAWTQTYEESCRATHVRGEQSQELLDLRSACLNQHKAELGGLVELLVAADGKLVRRAPMTVTALSPVSECDDIAGLQAPVKLPADKEARRAIETVREDLARLHARALVRDLSAVEDAEALFTRARALGYPPVEAEVELALGQLRGYNKETDQAAAHATHAFGTAAASNHDMVAVPAAFANASYFASLNQWPRAKDWLAIAVAMSHRLGLTPEREAAMHSVSGWVISSEGKYAEAATEYEACLELREKHEPGGMKMAITLSSLAHVYDELGRYDEARRAGERSLAIQEPLLGRWHPDIAMINNTLGNIADDQGDQARAIVHYKRAIEIREKLGDKLGIAEVYNNLGVIALNQEKYDEALAHQRRALAMREAAQADDSDLAMSKANIGDVLRRLGRFDEALPLYEQALALYEGELGKDHPYTADALLGIGDCKRALGDAVAAAPVLEKALKIRLNGARPEEIADVELALAKALWELGRRDRAVMLVESAHKAFAASPTGKHGLADIERWRAAHK